MLYLITFWDDELKQRIAFLVAANSRAQAKHIVMNHCLGSHLFSGCEQESDLRSHLMVVDNHNLLQRIDTLVN